MVYEKQQWENNAIGGTPINKTRLNHLETQYDESLKEGDKRYASRDSVGGIDLDRSYSKRLVHNLVYQHADAAAALATYGTGLYPQAFVIDPVADEILTISGPPQIVSVYSWSTGAYKGVIYSLGRTGVTESADIRYINGKRFLYTVDASGTAGTVVRFDITKAPTKLSTLNPESTYTVDVINSAHYRNGHWVTASNTPTSGIDSSFRNRARLSIYDDTFKQIGMAEFPSHVGGGSKQFQAASMPKMQGFDEGPGYFVFGIGGGTAGATTLTPYHYEGVRVVTPNGGVIIDSLLYADKMLEILNANGCNGNIIENEGVQIVDGKVYTLFPINSGASAGGKTGGIVVLEEFSTAANAIDFSSAAASWTMPDVRRYQSGSHPIWADGKLHNLVTGAALTSFMDICTYMQGISQDRFAFYSSDASILDANNNAIPAGYYVEILNRNFISWVVRLTGNGTVRTMLLSTDGTTWSQRFHPFFTSFTPASPLANVSGSTTNRYWIENGMVYLQFAVRPSGGGTLSGGNNVIINTGGLPANFRPDFNGNYPAAGNTSGPAMRLSVETTGLVQLVNVPDSTYTYAIGTVSWPAPPVL